LLNKIIINDFFYYLIKLNIQNINLIIMWNNSLSIEFIHTLILKEKEKNNNKQMKNDGGLVKIKKKGTK